MIIWFALIIPVISSIILYSIKEFRKKTAWWEAPSKIVVIALFILSIKGCSEFSQTRDTEYLMDYVVKVEHHTYWNEWINRTCTEQYACGSNKDGSTKYCTRTYDCSYEETYSPYTEVITKTNKRFTFYEGYEPGNYGVPTSKFNELTSKFNTTKKFVKTHKRHINTRYDNKHTPDVNKKFIGNVFSIKWGGHINTVESTTWQHTYENRIIASNNMYTYEKTSEDDIKLYGLYNYPSIYGKYKLNSLIGYDDKQLNDYINQKNSLIASKKQLKTHFLVFKNRTRKSALLQEQYWNGGNKNEVVVCIGIDNDNNITWSHVFSWSAKSDFKVEIRDNVLQHETLNSVTFKEIIDYSFTELETKFVRREFAEFSYLTVEPTRGLIIATYIFSFIFSVALSIFIVKNDFDL